MLTTETFEAEDPAWGEPPPRFDDPADERRHRQERLAGTFRIFGERGYDHGVAGHVTARDPEDPNLFWVNPVGVAFDQIGVSDLLGVNHDGEVVRGTGKVNPAAFAIHSRIHAARPDVVAAAHAHSVAGRAFSTLGRLLDPITQDSSEFFESHGIHADFTGVVLDLDEGDAIADALGPHKAVILANHGLLTVGSTVDEAAWLFISMDSACQVQLAAEAAGGQTLVSEPVARKLGAGRSGWYEFQPYWSRIAARQPDLFD